MRFFGLLAVLVAGLIASLASSASAADSGDVSLDQVLPLPILRSVTDMAVFKADTGTVRWLKVLKDVEPEQTAERLSRFLARPVAADVLRVVREDGGAMTCHCSALLAPGEFLVSEEPIKDVSGRYVSINDESYKAIAELIDYPMTSSDLVGVALSELTYVNNDIPVRSYLEARGFTVLLTNGFLNAERRTTSLTLPLIVASHAGTKAAYVAIRGTAEVSDLRTSLQAELVPWAAQLGLVHKGFYDAATETIRLVEGPLNEIRAQDPKTPIFAVGHSLGAAVASLLTLKLADEFPTLHALGFAPPPIGNSAFLDGVRKYAGNVTTFFVPNEEIRSLGNLSQISKLQWVGTERLLADMGTTANRHHYVINYLKAVLDAEGLSVKRYEQALPVCVLFKTPCFVGWRENTVPLCVLDDETCAKDRWLELHTWLSRTGKTESPEAARKQLSEMKIRVLRGNPPDYIRPLLFVTMARLAGDAGLAKEGLGYLKAAQDLTGPRVLYANVRQRLN